MVQRKERIMKSHMRIGLAVVLISAASASQAHSQMRFQGMDRDHDGVITRDEWRGSDTSFRNQDWNNDGVLSGDEVRPGAKRPQANRQNSALWDRFNNYDRNRDGRITPDEWRAVSSDQSMFS